MARRRQETKKQRVDDLDLLTETRRGTPMGDLLRQFWQPVAITELVEPGRARAVRVLNEDLTLYRGESGKPYLVAGRCAHRCSRLHTGWVEGDEVRCIYHGWKYDGTGQCVEMPAEKESLAETVKIAGYPTHEYCGIIFAYFGEGGVPSFELPRKHVYEESNRILFVREQTWPCHWLQLVENSMDSVHVSFVHQKGRIGIFGKAVTPAIPSLEFFETFAGMRQIATRSADNVRVSDWTFPNNNHVLVPGITKEHPWMDLSVWMMAVDDHNVSRFTIYAVPSSGPEMDRMTAEHFSKHLDYYPAEHDEELFVHEHYPEEMAMELVSAQDYIAAIGQGAVVQRANERLGSSDAGVVLLRRIFWREMEAMRIGKSIKRWKQLNQDIEMQSPQTVQAART